MLDASDQNPADREEYERKLDEMVDAIHRLDLAGLGAAAGIEEGKFEKAPLEDILQMTFPGGPQAEGQGAGAGGGHGFAVAPLGERRRSGIHQLLLRTRPQRRWLAGCSAPAATGP